MSDAPNLLLVYLDSRDLIDLEREELDAELLPSLFSAARTALVLSHTIIYEFSIRCAVSRVGLSHAC